MRALENKLESEGKTLLRIIKAILKVRALRSTIEGKELEYEDIKKTIEEKGQEVEAIKEEIARLMLEEYLGIKRAKKLLKEV